MKIIHITAAYKPAYIYGGPTMSVAKLCEALSEVELLSRGVVEMDKVELLRRGVVEENDVEVFTTTANGKAELDVVDGQTQIVDGVPVTYFKRLTKDHTHFSPGLLISLRKEILRDAQHDKTLIIHIHAWWNLVSILSCWVAKWYHVPVVLSPRGMLTAYTLGNRNVGFKSIIHFLVGKKLLRYCHIHATSEKEKEDILKFIKPKSITVIANLVEGVESGKLKVESGKWKVESGKWKVESGKVKVQSGDYEVGIKEQGLSQQQSNSTTQQNLFKLIFLSRIEEKKGLELLFEALAQFDVNWSLTIAGSGDKNYVESLKLKVESLKLQQRISWVGQVKNEDKFKLLAEYDLMVLTSYNENFANVVIESLSVGTPVLISDEVGLVDYVTKNDLGWVTELNHESITKKLNESYLAFSKRQKIRAEAPNIILNDYNDKVLVEKYINLYKNLFNYECMH